MRRKIITTNAIFIDDRVMYKGDAYKNRISPSNHGTVIGFAHDGDQPVLVEFDDNMGGHDGLGKGSASGRHGHCWYVPADDLEVVNDYQIPDKISIPFEELL